LIETLLDVIEHTDESGTLCLRELSFNILSNLCQECRDNQKAFRRLKGIEALRSNLNNLEVDQSGNSTTFLVSVLDCLSNAVFDNKRSQLHFLDIEGVQVLLDLIENCEYTLKRLALSCLCTLLENKKSFQSFVEWNSHKSGLNATQLLIRLYEDENKRFGVEVTDGILQNTERPLFPKLSYLIQKYANEDDINEIAAEKSQVKMSQQSISETSQ
jgi:hypothetical protein